LLQVSRTFPLPGSLPGNRSRFYPILALKLDCAAQ
jgi:hypothetical protein